MSLIYVNHSEHKLVLLGWSGAASVLRLNIAASGYLQTIWAMPKMVRCRSLSGRTGLEGQLWSGLRVSADGMTVPLVLLAVIIKALTEHERRQT